MRDILITVMSMGIFVIWCSIPVLIFGYVIAIGGRKQLLQRHPYLKRKRNRFIAALGIGFMYIPIMCCYSIVVTTIGNLTRPY